MALLCFDLDNTLVSRRDPYLAWAKGFTHRRGIPVDQREAFFDDLARLDRNGFAAKSEWVPEFCQKWSDFVTEQAFFDDYQEQFYPAFFAADGVLAGLERLRAVGHALAIVTNGPTSQRLKIDHSGLGAVFDVVVVSGEVEVEKPDPRIFAIAAETAGVELAGWMVGDQLASDIGGAQAAGLGSIWIENAYAHEADGVEHEPDVTVSSIQEAIQFLIDLAIP